jgi:hypothetical protein
MCLQDTLTACVEFKVKSVLYVGIEIQVHSSEETVALNATGRH